VSADLLSDLIAGYESGETTYQLASTHGLNRNTVAAHLRSAGVSIRMDSMTPEQIELAMEYYRTGWSLARIGHEVGADAETVRKRLRERGVTLRSTSRRSAGEVERSRSAHANRPPC
jgi:lambda repressor-like predicted transcriptional regulator